MDPKVFQKRGILLSEKMQYKIKAIPKTTPMAQITGDFDLKGWLLFQANIVIEKVTPSVKNPASITIYRSAYEHK